MSRKRLLAAAIVLVALIAVLLARQAGWFAGEPPAEPETALPAATAEAAAGQDCDGKREPRFPVALDSTIPFEDALDGCAYGEAPYRAFKLAIPPAEERYFMAVYLREPDWQRDRDNEAALITRVGNLGAAFTEDVAVDMPAAGEWERIRVHVGGFSQDYCGLDAGAVVSFRNAGIFAILHVGQEEIDLAASQCPLRPEDYLADRAKFGQRDAPDDLSAFCAVRRECLQAYYGKPENQRALRPRWLEEVANVRLR